MMAGLIVFVQVVHYPLKARVGPEAFVAYQAGHTARTSWVVVPLMLAELASALWLAALPPAPSLRPVALLGALLVGAVWISTALIQAPAHGRLSRGFDVAVHRRLVRSNWIRTGAWLARVPVALALVLPWAGAGP
jgi:hypothetical protein